MPERAHATGIVRFAGHKNLPSWSPRPHLALSARALALRVSAETPSPLVSDARSG